MPLLKKWRALGVVWVKKLKIGEKMKNVNNSKWSHITLESPITNEDLHNKLFQAVSIYGYQPADTITITISNGQERNRKVYFSNQNVDWSEDYILVGQYKYCNFFSPKVSALAFAKTITDRVIMLSMLSEET